MLTRAFEFMYNTKLLFILSIANCKFLLCPKFRPDNFQEMNSGIELGQDSSVKISFRANPKPSVAKWNIDNYRIMLGAGGSSMDSESHFKSRLYLLGFYCDMGAFKNWYFGYNEP